MPKLSKRDELLATIESLAEQSERIYGELEIGYLLLEISVTARQFKKKGLKRLKDAVSEHQATIVAESCTILG